MGLYSTEILLYGAHRRLLVCMDPAAPSSVVARQLTKTFDESVAVQKISFTIHAGECFGFLGPNGAGKTTTMRMMGCVSPPSGGELHVLGLDARTQARAIKRRLGVVPQDDNSDQYLSASENLELYGRYFDLTGNALRQRVMQSLEFVQLKDRANSEVRTLSGGMRRRLLIGRALISEPELVILDEPTTGLDPQARHLLWERLRILKSQQRTLILSTHYMDEAEQLCDRLVIMENGRIIALGAPSELIAQHCSREVVEVFAQRADREAIVKSTAGRVDRAEMLEDRLLLFAASTEVLLRDLAADFRTAKVLQRRSTLEDVFLKLTGRQLLEAP